MSGQALPNSKRNQPSSRWWSITLVASGILLIIIFILAARRSKSVEETVTLSQNPQHRATVGRPVATRAPVQVGDRDLESIGDRIAEATVYLRERQRGPALHSIAAAEAATHQLRSIRPDLDEQILKATEVELVAIEREVQRGNTETARLRLVQLGRTIDAVNQFE
jgi:hypothetical protein